jgi:hypothetical protein
MPLYIALQVLVPNDISRLKNDRAKRKGVKSDSAARADDADPK